MRLVRLGCVLLVAATAVVPAHASGRAVTGIQVRVMRLAPDEITCIREPCTLPSARVTVSVFRKGILVARGRTGTDGRIRFRVRPGVYAVRVPRLAPENGVSGQRVLVTKGRMAEVLLVQRPLVVAGVPSPSS